MPVTVHITGQDSLEDARAWLAGHDWPSAHELDASIEKLRARKIPGPRT